MDMLEPSEIKEVREALGLTMQDFAEKLGVSVGTISLWESGKRHPKWKTMRELNKLRDEARSKPQSGKELAKA